MSKPTKDIKDLARELLAQANISAVPRLIEPIKRSGNNQIYHIDCNDQQFILKKYFQHLDDGRNRLASEFNFLKATHDRTPNQTPLAYAKIEDDNASLYEYIQGKTILNSSNISEIQVAQAAQFIANLNFPYPFNLEKTLPPASEACFSIRDHINIIDSRIEELIHIKPHHQNDSEFNQILDEIILHWMEIKISIIGCCQRESIDLDQELPLDERVLSPSDFGFHNAIVRPDKKIAFIDFEYAGWDDPAKLAGDFFSQVAIKVDTKYLNTFLKIAFKKAKNYNLIQKRVVILLNAYKIKWCCIVLNIYIPKNLARRQFSNPSLNTNKLKKSQLKKARQLLTEILF
jgi:thiamine kinase-like enzyme